VRGYEYQKGDYVVLDEKDFKKALPQKFGAIEIIQFSRIDEIDIKYYEKPYYIEPDKKSTKAYTLLSDALKKSGKLAIAKFIMKDKEHIAAIKSENDVLILNQLRFSDEIRKPELEVPKGKYTAAEMEMATALIKKLTKKFNAEKYHDTYTEKLEKIIEAKAKGRTVKMKGAPSAPADTNMKDLIKMLKKSLDQKPVPSKYYEHD
jgi:DNA end-binding protein Ku